jgi:hypothetical protein
VPFFPSMKTPIVNPSMPSRIMGSGGGGQSELATKKAALEDDGAGNLQCNLLYNLRYDVITCIVLTESELVSVL